MEQSGKEHVREVAELPLVKDLVLGTLEVFQSFGEVPQPLQIVIAAKVFNELFKGLVPRPGPEHYEFTRQWSRAVLDLAEYGEVR